MPCSALESTWSLGPWARTSVGSAAASSRAATASSAFCCRTAKRSTFTTPAISSGAETCGSAALTSSGRSATRSASTAAFSRTPADSASAPRSAADPCGSRARNMYRYGSGGRA